MKVIITGGAGMVGSHVAEFYARRGAEVVVFDNLSRSRIFSSLKPSVEHTWSYLESLKGVRCVRGDICHPDEVEQVFRGGADAVVHAAAQPGVRFSIENPKADFQINAAGSVNVFEAIRVHAPRASVVYCSTNKVYGGNVSRLPLEEKASRYVFADARAVDLSVSTDQTLHTPYGVSKYTGDLYAQEYAQAYGLRTAVFRMSCAYGPRQFGFEDQGWLAHFVISALKNRPVTIYGDGKQVRDCLYVEDLVHAFDAFLSGDTPSDVFNIGGGSLNTLSLLELVQVLEKELKKPVQHSFESWRLADQKVYISDISRVSKILDWKPTVSPEEGIRNLISWTRQNLDQVP